VTVDDQAPSPTRLAPGPESAVLARVAGVVQDVVKDWDVPDEIAASTRLVDDLGCSSVDIINIVVAVEEEFGTRHLGFAELLFRNNRYVDDVTVGEIARFVADKLEACTS
jgi:acyl carrier protein